MGLRRVHRRDSRRAGRRATEVVRPHGQHVPVRHESGIAHPLRAGVHEVLAATRRDAPRLRLGVRVECSAALGLAGDPSQGFRVEADVDKEEDNLTIGVTEQINAEESNKACC